jgi:hypothetical protein
MQDFFHPQYMEIYESMVAYEHKQGSGWTSDELTDSPHMQW